MGSCSSCGYQNPHTINTCLNCAAALAQNCPACEQPVPIGNKFCGQCGARLAHNPAPPATPRAQAEILPGPDTLPLSEQSKTMLVETPGERREVAILFLDVTDYTAATRTLDSEDAYLLVNEALSLLVEVVYKYEGIIDKFTGDGLMALFGAPVAHENDSERAVRAALEMQTVLQPLQARIRQEYGFDFQVRIGINTGLVVAGQLGNHLHTEYTVIGSTVNLACRLEKAADPGTVLVSFETYQHTKPLFKYKALPPFAVKGIPQPIQAFQALGVQAKPGKVRGLPGLHVPMIGRTYDLTRLQNAWAEMRRHRYRQVVLVTGEAGLGKSRLVAEFCASVAGSEAKIYQGGCLAYARSTPLWVVANLLRAMLHLSESTPADVQQRTLQARLDQLNLDSENITPYLSNVLGFAQQSAKLETRLRHLDPAMLQQQTHAALRQLFLAEAQLAPTVLIFEDLHWIDPASREFLGYLIQTTGEAQLLLILVSRDIERETVIRPLITVAKKDPTHWVDIQLNYLSREESLLLLDQLVKQVDPEAQRLKQRIAERAEGNPFYIEEIIRMLLDEDVNDRMGKPKGMTGKLGTWLVTPRTGELLGQVPGTVKGLILARFDRLPERLRQTLQKAAVLGASFPVSLLQSLNGVDQEALTAQLEELAARHFLLAEPFGAEPGYAFQHALTQEAVYSTLLNRERNRLHKQVAQVIEAGSFWSADERIEVLAHHYAESSSPTKAIPYLLEAAEKAARRCANETAIQHYRRAMALLPNRPDDLSHEFFQVRLGLGRAFKFVGEFTAASQVLCEALQHVWKWSLADQVAVLQPFLVDSLRELADIRQREGAYDKALNYLETGLHVLGENSAEAYPSLWRSLLDRMAWVHFRQGELEKAFTLASLATGNVGAQNADDPSIVASLYNTLGGICWQQGKLDEAIAHVERSLNLYENLGYFWGMANAYSNLGVLYDILGGWSEAAKYHEQAFALRQVIGDLQHQAVSLNNLGFLHMVMGQHETALQKLIAARNIGQHIGDNWIIAQAQVNLAQLAIIQSRFEDATTHAQVALALSDSIGSSEIKVQAGWILALIPAEPHHLQANLESAEQALKLAKAAGFMEGNLDCLRVLGILHARAGNFAQAETLLRNSAALSLKQNDPYRQGLALLELGGICQRLSSNAHPAGIEWQAKGVTALNEAQKIFESLGAAYDLRLSRAALSQLQVELAAEALPSPQR